MKWLLLLALAVTLAVAFTAKASDPLTGRITLVGTVTEHYTLGTGGPLGRETWYFSLASSRRKGRPFGYGILACQFISAKSSVRECSGTFSLPRGKIIVAGSFLYPGLYELAVTGGIDDYSGVGGSLFVRRFSDRPDANWLTFNLI